MATTSQDIKTPPADKASDSGRLIKQLKAIVGDSYVLTSPESTRQYRTGFRFGSGPVLAVVRPGSLVEQWKVLNACVAANKIIIMQAANTGLTGGSTPDGDDYDREIVIVSTAAHGEGASDRRRPAGDLPSRRHALSTRESAPAT